jgi:hypothetical protein
MPRVLAFDIGIKNLAWCCMEKDGSSYRIIGWDNYNLLQDSSNLTATPSQTCRQCTAKATYIQQPHGLLSCARHTPVGYPPLRDISGNLLKKLPSVEQCRAMLTQSQPHKKPPTKKADCIRELQNHYSLPIETKKVSKAPDAGCIEIHDSLRKLIHTNHAMWSSCTTICLENQPAFKNPTMKSVQMMLFATLRDCLQQPPPLVKLVHAGKKVQGVETGDAGYKERKAGSEARAELFLKDAACISAEPWQAKWASAKKKSDLADALAMCIDCLKG